MKKLIILIKKIFMMKKKNINYMVVIVALINFLSCDNKIIPTPQSTVKLAVQPYENFSKQEVAIATKVLDSFFDMEITVLPSKKIDPRAYVQIKMPRYRADSMIKFQKEFLKETSFDYILGLTHKDISTTKKEKVHLNSTYYDWGILGLAYLDGNSCVISTFRMNKEKAPKKFGLRFRKVVIHEFGHNLNLPHCPNKKCVMTSAVESMTNIDRADLSFCEKCTNKMTMKPKI